MCILHLQYIWILATFQEISSHLIAIALALSMAACVEILQTSCGASLNYLPFLPQPRPLQSRGDINNNNSTLEGCYEAIMFLE